MNLSNSPLLDTREAARYLKLKPQTLAHYRARGGGPPFIRFGIRAVRYRLTDLDKWIADNVVAR